MSDGRDADGRQRAVVEALLEPARKDQACHLGIAVLRFGPEVAAESDFVQGGVTFRPHEPVIQILHVLFQVRGSLLQVVRLHGGRCAVE